MEPYDLDTIDLDSSELQMAIQMSIDSLHSVDEKTTYKKTANDEYDRTSYRKVINPTTNENKQRSSYVSIRRSNQDPPKSTNGNDQSKRHKIIEEQNKEYQEALEKDLDSIILKNSSTSQGTQETLPPPENTPPEDTLSKHLTPEELRKQRILWWSQLQETQT